MAHRPRPADARAPDAALGGAARSWFPGRSLRRCRSRTVGHRHQKAARGEAFSAGRLKYTSREQGRGRRMSNTKLKPLSQQTIVITGATSGIGLATARRAVGRGAAVVLTARNEDALRRLDAELRGRGGRVVYRRADVADPAQVEAVAAAAEETFGGFDSWVNNAGTFIFGRTDEVSLEDHRRVFDVVYWGTVHGTLTASRHLAVRGGAIVNVGSVLGDRALALQGPYSAAKHAVKGITDSFRMEFESAGLPVSVTLIKPGAIDTPYVEHARNLTGALGVRNPPPAYDPGVVAEAILYACRKPVRDLYVGSSGLATTLAGQFAPRLTDLIMEVTAERLQTGNDPGRPRMRDSLHTPREDLAERGAAGGGPVRQRSLLLEAQINPVATVARAAGEVTLRVGRSALRRLLRHAG
jgi:NAD(P)-dependent dehydrogenase (short-subunit alcohol dehydrogenase family)